MEGLGSSGRLVGSISTYPGTCKCPWSRVMTKNPPSFTEYGMTTMLCKLMTEKEATISMWCHTGDGKKESRAARLWLSLVRGTMLYNFGFQNVDFLLFPGVLEGLGSSGRLVGTISTCPGTCKCPCSRVIAKNPGASYVKNQSKDKSV